MIAAKTVLRDLLINNAALTALVPAARIFTGWPDTFQTLPLVAFVETNNYNTDDDYFDNRPIADHVTFTIHVFTEPKSSTTAIAQAIDDVLEANLWNRDAANDLKEPDTGYNHKVMIYSTRIER